MGVKFVFVKAMCHGFLPASSIEHNPSSDGAVDGAVDADEFRLEVSDRTLRPLLEACVAVGLILGLGVS